MTTFCYHFWRVLRKGPSWPPLPADLRRQPPPSAAEATVLLKIFGRKWFAPSFVVVVVVLTSLLRAAIIYVVIKDRWSKLLRRKLRFCILSMKHFLEGLCKVIFLLKRKFEIITFTSYCSIFRALRLLRDGHASSSSISFFLALDFHPLSVVHHDSLRQCTFDESKLELILFMFFPRPSYILSSFLEEIFFLKCHHYVCTIFFFNL